MKHAFDAGVVSAAFKKGFDHSHVKLKIEDVRFIREKRKNREMKLKELGALFNITPDHVCRIANNRVSYLKDYV